MVCVWKKKARRSIDHGSRNADYFLDSVSVWRADLLADALSVQLPIAIFALVYLTSSKKVMGKYANSKKGRSCFGRSERQLAFYRQFHPLVFS